MEYRFYKDPDTGMAHCRNHGVTELEAISVVQSPGRLFRNQDESLVAEGQTLSGRYIRVVYREDSQDDSIFVITAYDMGGKAKRAYRRRKGK